jgi:F0F1-type ATP synthase assembly protein I
MAVIIGCFMFLLSSGKTAVTTTLFYAATLTMSVAGWLRAERVVLEFGVRRAASQQTVSARGRFVSPTGFGGIPFALLNSFVRVWSMGIMMVVGLNLLNVFLQKHPFDWHHLTKPLANGGFMFPFFFVFLIQSASLLWSFRYLRTLPISTGRLVTFMFSEAILPLLTMCLAITALAWHETGSAECLSLIKVEIMAAAATSVFMAVTIWNTTTSFVKGMLLAVLILSSLIPMVYEMGWGMSGNNSLPVWFVATFTVGLLALSHWATCRIISRSSDPYRNRPMMAGFGNWGGGR